MIDENEIEQSALEYADQNWEKPYYSSSVPNAAKDSFMAGAKWALEQSQWILTEEKMPNECLPVLVFIPEQDHINTAVYEKTEGWYATYEGISITSPVTHWMPLPEPPKQ